MKLAKNIWIVCQMRKIFPAIAILSMVSFYSFGQSVDDCEFASDFSMDVIVPDTLEKGEEYIIPFLSNNFVDVASFLFTLSYDPRVMVIEELIDAQNLDGSIETSTLQAENGHIFLLHSNYNGIGGSVENGTELFSIRVEITGESCEETTLEVTEKNNIFEVFFDAGKFCISTEPFPLNLSNPLVVSLNEINLDYSACFNDGLFDLTFESPCAKFPLVWELSQQDVIGSGTLESEEDRIVFNGLAQDNYFLTVLSTEDDIFLNLSLFETDTFTFDLEIENPRCSSSSGTANLVINGNDDQDYAIEWSNCFFNINEVNHLASGTYFVTVTDELGCSKSDSFEIVSPPRITFDIIDFQNCGSETILTYEISGGTPGSGSTPYILNDIPSSNSETLILTSDTILSVLVSDTVGCRIEVLIDPTLFASDSDEVLADEDFSEWQNISAIQIDSTGDSPANEDYTFFKVSNDETYIYLQLGFDNEIPFQEENNLLLKLEYISQEFGRAEINYRLGERNGILLVDNRGITLNHTDIGLVSAPTVSSDTFEIVIRREIFTSTEDFGKIEGTILITFDSVNGDRMPDTGSFTYNLQECEEDNPVPVPNLDKDPQADFRLLSYNVQFEQLFDPQFEENYRRIFDFIKPDIIAFQEIFDRSAFETQAFYQQLTGIENWFSKKEGTDLIVLSKYPILQSTNIGGNGAFLLEVEEEQLLLVNVHFPCCDNNQDRQNEIDNVLRAIRDMKNNIHPEVNIEEDTPIIICGDFNLVGPQSQQESILTGNIIDEDRFGFDLVPDWDGSNFTDSRPITTGHPSTFTWYSEIESFSPSRLDYVLYTNSVMTNLSSYNLFSPNLTDIQLEETGLLADDILLASDHLPVVTDFAFGLISGNEFIAEKEILFEVFPNPAHQEVMIRIQLSELSSGKLQIFNLSGSLLFVKNMDDSIGDSQLINVDISNYVSGLYYVSLQSEDKIQTKKLIITE